MDKVIFGLE
ncbi:Protein of unknown function [Bacillus mycoides]|nr:Protein of unknown function [Bacillus mycoides]